MTRRAGRFPMMKRVILTAAVVAAGAGAGCTLVPEARPDPSRHYVLAAAAGPVAPARATLLLRPVEIPAYLRQPALVVRRGEHEVALREAARWGEPLEQGLARVLGENLRRLGLEPAAAAGARAGDLPALSVRVLACEGTAAGGIAFRAVWEIRAPGAARPVGGAHVADGLRWNGRTEESLAAGLSEAVAGLAAEIAARWPAAGGG